MLIQTNEGESWQAKVKMESLRPGVSMDSDTSYIKYTEDMTPAKIIVSGTSAYAPVSIKFESKGAIYKCTYAETLNRNLSADARRSFTYSTTGNHHYSFGICATLSATALVSKTTLIGYQTP